MQYNNLGQTGIRVSELCFGALPMGPMQSDLSPEEGAKAIVAALEQGVNFIDTAQLYRTYPHIRKALDQYSGEVVINSKSSAETYEDMEAAIQEALTELKREYIDIFLLHAARVKPDVFEKRAGAWACLQDYKRKGYLRAIGISLHSVTVAERAIEIPEVDVIFPLVNRKGLGILDGDLAGMCAAIERAHQAGKGLYAMKALAGGCLLSELPEAIEFVRKLPGIQSVALGMINEQELEVNLKVFRGEALAQADLANLKNTKKIHIMPFCEGCGNCVQTCPSHALTMVDGRPEVDTTKCVLCGYCTPVCPQFSIRLR